MQHLVCSMLLPASSLLLPKCTHHIYAIKQPKGIESAALTSSGLDMPRSVTATSGLWRLCLRASLGRGTPCSSAYLAAFMPVSFSSWGAGCHGAGPCSTSYIQIGKVECLKARLQNVAEQTTRHQSSQSIMKHQLLSTLI